MILSIVFLIGSLIVQIPIVFSVNKTNNNVLTTFAMIPLIDINNFVKRCELFKAEYLDEKGV